MYNLAELKAKYKALNNYYGDSDYGSSEDDDSDVVHSDAILKYIISNANSISECGILDDVLFFCKVLYDCEHEYEAWGGECDPHILYFPELIEEVLSILYNLYMHEDDERAKEPFLVACKLLHDFTYPSGFFDDMKDDSKHWEYLSAIYAIEAYTYDHYGPIHNTDLEEVTRQSIRRFDNGDMNQKLYILRFWSRILEKYIDAIEVYFDEDYYSGDYAHISPENDNLSRYITAATLTMLPELFSKFNQCYTDSIEATTCFYSLLYNLRQLGCHRLFPDMDTSRLIHDVQLIHEEWEEEENPRRSLDAMLYVVYQFYDLTTDESKVPFSFIKDALFSETTARKLKSGEVVPSSIDVYVSDYGYYYSKFRYEIVQLIKKNTFIQEVLTKNMSNSFWYLMFMEFANGNREGFEWHTCLTSDDAILRGLCLETIKPKEQAQVPQFEEILVNSLKLAEEESNFFLSMTALQKCVKMERHSPLATQVLEHIFTHLEIMPQQVEGYGKMLEQRHRTEKILKLLKPGWYIFSMLSSGKMLSFSEYLIDMIPNIPSDDFKSGLKDFVELLMNKRDEVCYYSFAQIMYKVLVEVSDISPIEKFVPALVEVLKEGVKYENGYTRAHSIVCLVLLSSMVQYKSDLYGTIFDTIIENIPSLEFYYYSHIRPYFSNALVNANDEIKRRLYDWLILEVKKKRWDQRRFLSSNVELAFKSMIEHNDQDLFLAYELREDNYYYWARSRIETIKQVYELDEYVVTRQCDCPKAKDWEMAKPIKQLLIECILRVLTKDGRKLRLMKTHSVDGVFFKILNNGWQEMDRLSLDLAKWFDEMKDDREFNDICERLPEELKPKLAELMF